MLSGALREARARGELVQPVLTVDFIVRGFSLGRGVYAPAKVSYPGVGTVGLITVPGGWKEVAYGSGVRTAGFEVVTTTVDVADPDGELLRTLETYDPRGSAVAGRWAAGSVIEADWTPFFTGILSDWSRKGLTTSLVLKTDDSMLRTPVPRATFLKAEWGSAAEPTIFGTPMPVALGIFDAFLITARGALPCLNIRYDKDTGYWWLVAANRMKRVRRLNFDGVTQPDSIWSTIYGVFGGNLLTIVSVAPGSQPDKNVVVSVDADGPDADGLGTGDPLVNPVAQLRAILQEWVYRAAPLVGWRGPHAILDAASWDAGEDFFDLHGYDSAVRFGGDQNADTGVAIIESFLKAYPWTRISCTRNGTLAFAVLDPDEPERDEALAMDMRVAEGGMATWTPGDAREVYTEVAQPYLHIASDSKYGAGLSAHDPAALPERLALQIENPWTQARFTQEP